MVRTINLSESIRTNCAEKLLRTISLTAMHIKLMAMFVSRYELEKQIQAKQKEVEEQLERAIITGRAAGMNDEEIKEIFELIMEE